MASQAVVRASRARGCRRPADEPTASAGPTFAFRVEGRMPRGPYVVEVEPFGYRRIVRFPCDEGGIDLTVPEPVRLRVRVVNAETGGDVPTASAWAMRWPDVSPENPPRTLAPRPEAADPVVTYGSGVLRMDHDDDPAAFVANVPGGRIDLQVSADGYRSMRRTLRLSAPTRDLTIRLRQGEGSDREPDEP